MKHCLVNFTKFVQIVVQESKMALRRWDPGFENKIYIKNLLLKAQVLENWYVTLPCGPLPSSFN